MTSFNCAVNQRLTAVVPICKHYKMDEEQLADVINKWVDDFDLAVSLEDQDSLVARLLEACSEMIDSNH